MQAVQLTLDLFNQNPVVNQSKSPHKSFIPLVMVAHKLAKFISQSERISTQIMTELMSEHFGGSDAQGKWIGKDAYDALELAIVLYLKQNGANFLQMDADKALEQMLELQMSLPTHTRRSQAQCQLQQFSTPLAMSFLVAKAAMLKRNDIILEPSAGNGLLAVWAHGLKAKIILNEIDAKRRQYLKALFPHAPLTNYDGEQIDDYLNPKYQPTVVLMNPPFSRSPKMRNKVNRMAMGKHVKSALWRLQTGGRLVTISADSFSPHDPFWREYFIRLRKFGHLVFSAGIEGKAYAKHGTNFPTRLTVIERSAQPENHWGEIVDAQLSLPDLLHYLEIYLPQREKLTVETSRPQLQLIPQFISREEWQFNLGDFQKQPTSTAKAPTASQSEIAAIEPVGEKVGAEAFEDVIAVKYSILPDRQTTAELSEGIYEAYQPQTIKIEGAKPHPSPLVQSTAMASVRPPIPTYIPQLPGRVIREGLLSEAQLETVIYAGEAHQKYLCGWYLVEENFDQVTLAAEGDPGAVRFRRGYYLGDHTGCGKGRQIAGIILDNWLKGRTKAVWISQTGSLVEDAKRDFKAIGGDENQVVSLAQYKQGETISLTEAILFTTYATLRSPARQGKRSRLEQIINWLGQDSDAVVVFDESHALANGVSQRGERGVRKASQQGMAGIRLQRALANARFLFVSATGATKLTNLSYLERLGLWGTSSFPFRSREEFLSQIGQGGVAALEVVSRDLKALGLYCARSLSFDGVEYEIIDHLLTPAQSEIYDRYARAYQIIYQNIERALTAINIISDGGNVRNSRSRSNAYSAFEGAKQRFFNHLLTSLKCPTLIKSIERDLANGYAAVIQLISTDEALLDRRLAHIPASQYHDLQVDITPREYLFDYLMSAFPTQLHQVYCDLEGVERTCPVKDDNGNPVQSQEALRQRDELIEKLALLPPIPSALDQIIHHFGQENVAEITGRSQRIIREVTASSDKLVLQNRSARANLAETNAFMNDEKQILIFSQAGGTGASYHADLNCQNQRLRRHYLLQAGFRADVAIQGLGRTNRSNQAQAPVFCVLTTNVKGEKRFTSTISSRLDSLGALTKGERKTGGQGLFKPEDNLESIYAKTALRQLYQAIYRGQIGLSLEYFENATGLKLSNEGGLKEELPPMRQFLNRCLALQLAEQELLFEALEMRINTNIEAAKEAGTWERGVETLKGKCFKVLARQPLYTDPESGAVSYAVKIERAVAQPILTLDKALSRRSQGGKLFVNQRSGRAAVVIPSNSQTSCAGEVISRVNLIFPHGNQKMTGGELERSHWRPVSEIRFRTIWEQEIATIPPFKTDTFFLITGLLLPIWNRLDPTRMRIYRLQTNDGDKLLGRVVTAEAIAELTQSFNFDCDLTATEIVTAARNGDKPVPLQGGLKLQTSRVGGNQRLEIIGFSGQTQFDWLKSRGAFAELINYQLRAFLPNDDSAVVMVEKILTELY